MFSFPEVLRPFTHNILYRLLLLVFITSFLIPLLSIVGMKFSNFIHNYNLDNKKERPIPFLIVALLYSLMTYYYYNNFQFNNLLFVTFLSITTLMFIILFITLTWKISMHSASMWGVFGYIYALALKWPINYIVPILSTLVIINGVAMSARLKLNAHTPAQILAGGMLGFIVCFLFYYFMIG